MSQNPHASIGQSCQWICYCHHLRVRAHLPCCDTFSLTNLPLFPDSWLMTQTTMTAAFTVWRPPACWSGRQWKLARLQEKVVAWHRIQGTQTSSSLFLVTDACLKIIPSLDDASWACSYPLPSTSASPRCHHLPHANKFLGIVQSLKHRMDVLGKEVIGCWYALVFGRHGKEGVKRRRVSRCKCRPVVITKVCASLLILATPAKVLVLGCWLECPVPTEYSLHNILGLLSCLPLKQS